MSKKILGNHYLIDYYNCDKQILSIVSKIEKIMIDAGKIGNLHIVGQCFHQFKPFGVSGVLILKESHFTVHTWPEYNYASVDLYLCDTKLNVLNIVEYLDKMFVSENYEIKKIERGIENEKEMV